MVDPTMLDLFSRATRAIESVARKGGPIEWPSAESPSPLDRAAGSLEDIARSLDTLVRAFHPAGGSSSVSCDAPEEARSAPEGVEEVIIRYTVGQATFDPTGKYIVLKARMYTLDGTSDGDHTGVFESLDPDPAALLRWFTPAEPPYDEASPVETDRDHIEVRAHTKAQWTFKDGSSIISTGPAVVHLARFRDGTGMFFVSVAGSITHGTGRYAGALGIKTATGSTYLTADASFGPGTSFPGKTIETFRVINKRHVIAPPKDAPSAAFPYRSRWASVRGSRMHYIEDGSGDTILFLHGNPEWSYTWRNIIPYVKDRARCIAVDLIGMGRSGRPDIDYRFSDHAEYLEGFIDELGLERMTLVMTDWGAVLGFDYAMRYPHKIKALAFAEALFFPYASWDDFLAPGGPPEFRQQFQQFRDGTEGSGEGWQLLVEQNVMVEQLLPATAGRKLSAGERQVYVEPFAEKPHRKVMWRLVRELPIEGQPADVAQRVTEYSERLQRSNVPKLLLAGWPGVVTTPYHVAWATAHLKNLTVAHLGWSLHMPQESDPDRFGSELAKWYSALP